MVREYCSVESQQSRQFESEDLAKVVAEAEAYEPTVLYTQFSSGQNADNFKYLWDSLGIKEN